MKKQRRNNARKLYDSSTSSDVDKEDKESTTHRHRKVSRNDDCHYNQKKEEISNQTKKFLQWPSLPKMPISLSMQSSLRNLSNEAFSPSTSRTDKAQCNVQTSTFFLLLKFIT